MTPWSCNLTSFCSFSQLSTDSDLARRREKRPGFPSTLFLPQSHRVCVCVCIMLFYKSYNLAIHFSFCELLSTRVSPLIFTAEIQIWRLSSCVTHLLARRPPLRPIRQKVDVEQNQKTTFTSCQLRQLSNLNPNPKSDWGHISDNSWTSVTGMAAPAADMNVGAGDQGPGANPAPPPARNPAAAPSSAMSSLMGRFRSLLMTMGSLALTTLVVCNAWYQRQQFYPSVVYITKSNPR